MENVTSNGAIRPWKIVEREHILLACRMTNGHICKAAEMIGIGKTTMYRKLLRYGAIEQKGNRQVTWKKHE